MEHVESMANIFEASKASSVALEAVLDRSIRQLSRRTGLNPKDLSSAPVYHAATSRVSETEDLAALIEQCRGAASSPDDPEKALALARRLGIVRAAMDRTGQKYTGPHD